jgi:hypothetical protein
MVPVEQLLILLERLNVKDRELALNIQLVTAWIKEHMNNRPAYECKAYYSWRKASFRLQNKRSELKIKQEAIQTHLRATAQKVEEFETDFFTFPVFGDQTLESELFTA